MPARRLPMRKIKEILRLKFDRKLTNRQIAGSCSIPHSTVANYLFRARAAGLSWPLPEGMDDTALEAQLFPSACQKTARGAALPNFAWIHEELRRHKHVTMVLLWQEYKQSHPDGYQYSRFCQLYNEWAAKLDPVLRQEHRAGEKLFVDHAGPTVAVVGRGTGEVREASIFVAVLGASNYTYAEATWNRDLPCWIGSHVRALEFLGGVPKAIVPDNWRTGVTNPCHYEPDLNPTYRDLADHYGTVILPARPRKPRDKAKVEAGVLVVERWILAALRHRTFFSLAELNAAIRELLIQLNDRKFRKLPTTRRRMFEELDRPALGPLPTERFRFGKWKKARANIDYHIEIEKHYYSVPYQLVHEQVEARIAATTVEIFFKGRRVATHMRSLVPGKHTTLWEHRPKSHQKYLQWNPSRIIHWAESVGLATARVIEQLLASKRYPELSYRGCLGILRLGKRYSEKRLEAACRRAVELKVCSYKSIKSILETGLDRQPIENIDVPACHNTEHLNIRGAVYYGGQEVTNAH